MFRSIHGYSGGVSAIFFFGSSTKWIGLSINLLFLIGIFAVYLLMKKREREQKFCILGLVVSLLYAIVVARTMPSPFYANRYIWPASGVVLLFVIIAVLSIAKELFQSEKATCVGSIFVATVICITGVLFSWNGRGLDYVNENGEERKSVISQYKEIPCVIYCESLNFEVISSYWDYMLFDNICWIVIMQKNFFKVIIWEFI